jgi:hypothetical protein
MGLFCSLVNALFPPAFYGKCAQAIPGTLRSLTQFDGDLYALIEGEFGQLGQFDSCVGNSYVEGQYCSLRLSYECHTPNGTVLNSQDVSICGGTAPYVPNLAVCVPRACTTAELNEQLKALAFTAL